MRNKTEYTEVTRQYATSYAAHYTEHDLPAAMRLYKQTWYRTAVIRKRNTLVCRCKTSSMR